MELTKATGDKTDPEAAIQIIQNVLDVQSADDRMCRDDDLQQLKRL